MAFKSPTFEGSLNEIASVPMDLNLLRLGYVGRMNDGVKNYVANSKNVASVGIPLLACWCLAM